MIDKTFLNITKIKAQQVILAAAIVTINQNIHAKQGQVVQLKQQLKRKHEQLRQLKDIEKRVGDL